MTSHMRITDICRKIDSAPWCADAPGVLAALAYSRPLLISPLLTIRKIGWFSDGTLVCHATHLKKSLFILNRFLVYFELFPCLFWAVSLFILNSFLVYFEPFPCLFWAETVHVYSDTFNLFWVAIEPSNLRWSCKGDGISQGHEHARGALVQQELCTVNWL